MLLPTPTRVSLGCSYQLQLSVAVISCSYQLQLSVPFAERELPVRSYPDLDGIALDEFPLENRHRQRILKQPLYRSLERTRAERGIVTFSRDHLSRLRSQLDLELPVG